MAPVERPPPAAADSASLPPGAEADGRRTSIVSDIEVAATVGSRGRELQEAEHRQQPQMQQQNLSQLQDQRRQEHEGFPGHDVQSPDADIHQNQQQADIGDEGENRIVDEESQHHAERNDRDIRREQPSAHGTLAPDIPSSQGPVQSEDMSQLARIHLLERQLQDSRLCNADVAALKERLKEREAEVFAFECIMESVRTTLEDRDKAAQEAAFYREIVDDWRRRNYSEPNELARLRHAHDELRIKFESMEAALKEDVRLQDSKVASLEYRLERQRQYSVEVQKALESKCDLFKSTNRLLS